MKETPLDSSFKIKNCYEVFAFIYIIVLFTFLLDEREAESATLKWLTEHIIKLNTLQTESSNRASLVRDHREPQKHGGQD